MKKILFGLVGLFFAVSVQAKVQETIDVRASEFNRGMGGVVESYSAALADGASIWFCIEMATASAVADGMAVEITIKTNDSCQLDVVKNMVCTSSGTLQTIGSYNQMVTEKIDTDVYLTPTVLSGGTSLMQTACPVGITKENVILKDGTCYFIGVTNKSGGNSETSIRLDMREIE